MIIRGSTWKIEANMMCMPPRYVYPLSSVLVQALPSCLLLKPLGREGLALEPHQQAIFFLVAKLLSDLLKYEIWVWHNNNDFYCILCCGEFSENFDLEN